jgi:RND family efflux transporter MFP subunit
VERLRQTGAVTASEYDALNSRLQSARAAVVEAQALVGDARITAPLTGVVARKDADPGDLAMPGRPLLRVEDPRHLRLEADVPASLLDRVTTGATFTVQVDGVRAPFEATVAEISPVADPATRTLRVRLDLPATEGLRPGQFGRVSIPVGEAECLMVPLSALVSRGQMEILFSVKEGKAQLRIVRTGRRLGEEVEIIAGLTSGETIVVENASALVDGQPLSPL